MNNQEVLSKNQRFLYIQFHTKESSAEEVRQLKESFAQTFGEMSTIVIDDIEDNEIVFRVETPVILDVESIRAMFLNIESVFEDFQSMYPHFTQIVVAP